MTRIRTPRRVALLGAGMSLLAAVTGCGSSEAGAAAVVDGRRITVADVQKATSDIQAFTGQQVSQRQVLYFLIIGPRVVDAAASAGIGVSASDARTMLVQKVAEPSEPAVAAIRANESVNRLSQLGEDKSKPIMDGLLAGLRAADIDVSPRYGTFDKQTVTMGTLKENWLAPTPSASGS
ncbi:MAG: hypothetical protein WAL50_05695 [Kineosporiaceae bacterium]